MHNDMQEAHTRLKRLDKDLKQLTTHQVHTTHIRCLSVEALKTALVYLLQLQHCQGSTQNTVHLHVPALLLAVSFCFGDRYCCVVVVRKGTYTFCTPM